MNLTYDKQADAAYIRLKDSRSVRTREESDVCILDIDEDGNVVGIELLSVFGFAGPSLHSLIKDGVISTDQAEQALRELKSELAAA